MQFAYSPIILYRLFLLLIHFLYRLDIVWQKDDIFFFFEWSLFVFTYTFNIIVVFDFCIAKKIIYNQSNNENNS